MNVTQKPIRRTYPSGRGSDDSGPLLRALRVLVKKRVFLPAEEGTTAKSHRRSRRRVRVSILLNKALASKMPMLEDAVCSYSRKVSDKSALIGSSYSPSPSGTRLVKSGPFRSPLLFKCRSAGLCRLWKLIKPCYTGLFLLI